ncbi:taurine catabolism dioxygenase TauD, TfdA family-domain-containing protein, partial [Xylaria castorea]
QPDQQPSEPFKISGKDVQPSHQRSQFDQFFQLDQQPSNPSKAPGKKTKRSPKPSQPKDFGQLDQQPSESSKASDENGQPSRQLSPFDLFLQLGQQPPMPSKTSGRKQIVSSRPSQFGTFLHQQPSEPIKVLGEDEKLFVYEASGPWIRKPSQFEKFVVQQGQQPPEQLTPSILPDFHRFRRTTKRPPSKFAQPKTKPYKDGHYWQSDLASNNSRISYRRTRLSEPFVVSRSWLRDACTCEKCVNPSSGQKNYASTDVPILLDISNLTVTEEGELLVYWENDFLTYGTHVSKYSRTLWDRMESVEIETIPEPRIWSRQVLTEASPYYSYQSFMTDGPEYRQAVTALSEFGLIFLRDIPSSEETVKGIASRLGVIQDTFYGTTWDVKSKPNAENVAYTNSYLGLHQDLLYMSNVPRIQILHCLENTCEGGESIFSDSYRAVHKFRRNYLPEAAEPLTNRKIVYHYNKGGHIYRSERAVFSDLGSSRIGVYWSPPFQSPVQSDKLTSKGMDEYKQWHKAARRMTRLIEEDAAIYRYKMKPGECVIFDNRRVLHGRLAFDTSSGERWLKGTYVENDSYNSLLRSLKLTSTFSETSLKLISTSSKHYNG